MGCFLKASIHTKVKWTQNYSTWTRLLLVSEAKWVSKRYNEADFTVDVGANKCPMKFLSDIPTSVFTDHLL